MTPRRLTAIAICAVVASVAAAFAQRPAGPSPAVKVITLPDFWGEYAIWGSSGADSQGRIWLGITSNDDGSASAHLFRYDPDARTVADTGDVIGALTRLGLRRPGEKQMKIHSRIVEMPDGFLYFASMDESGENADGSKLPDWGGHLWRIGPKGQWQHLARAKEALIAVAAGGPYVYALGYFDHVVYQYDTRTGKVNAKTVGSVEGHVSRNFFADERGHVFVPRTRRAGGQPGGKPEALLVELDPSLREVGATPIAEYFERGFSDSHGITGIHPDGGGGWHFVTGRGRLYQAVRQSAGASEVRDLGWFHPDGARYVASMFLVPTTGTLYGAACRSGDGGRDFEWVARPKGGPATVAALPYGDQPRFPHGAAVYGSMTRDRAGRLYVVGTMNYKPVVLQVTVP